MFSVCTTINIFLPRGGSHQSKHLPTSAPAAKTKATQWCWSRAKQDGHLEVESSEAIFKQSNDKSSPAARSTTFMFRNFAIWHRFSRFPPRPRWIPYTTAMGRTRTLLSRLFRTLPLHSSYPWGCDIMRKARIKKGKEKRGLWGRERGEGGTREDCATMSYNVQ